MPTTMLLLCKLLLSIAVVLMLSSPPVVVFSLEGPSQLADYTSETASLFNNMRTPASILAGSLVPLGFIAPLEDSSSSSSSTSASQEEQGYNYTISMFLRKVYPYVAVMSLCSILICVMWSTVAVNQLTESMTIAPTHSVWALIQRDFTLSWVATNAHFVAGMLGFMWMIGTRAYLSQTSSSNSSSSSSGRSSSGAGGDAPAAGMAVASLLLMISIINRGVAAGGGADGLRFGCNVMALFKTYLYELVKRISQVGVGPLEITSIALAVFSTVQAARNIFPIRGTPPATTTTTPSPQGRKKK